MGSGQAGRSNEAILAFMLNFSTAPMFQNKQFVRESKWNPDQPLSVIVLTTKPNDISKYGTYSFLRILK
jgi:hypothetical protein